MKKYAPVKCAKCGYAPSSNTDLAKSFILSKTFDVGELSFGRSPAELAQISDAIAAGAPYQFSEAEVADVRNEIVALKSVTPRRIVIDLVKWLGPPILVIAVAIWLAFHGAP